MFFFFVYYFMGNVKSTISNFAQQFYKFMRHRGSLRGDCKIIQKTSHTIDATRLVECKYMIMSFYKSIQHLFL